MTIPTAAELIQFLFDELEDYETPLVCLFGPGDLDEKGDPKGWAAKRFHPRLQWQGKASYISVGVFDVRLFEDDIPRAARANVTRCALLMLDDVGTKVPLSVLDRAPPTVLIETSAGNHQAQYKLHPKPAPDHFSAAVNALARLGLTDAGAKNATRWCRLPGSVNLKPGRGGFEAKVREWCEDNVWPLEELLEALGVELLEEDWVGAQYSGAPLRLGAPSADPVLQWLSDSGLLLRETGRDYWDIVCPNAEAHTDGNPAAGYDPAGGRFKCLHGHCTEITTAEFFSWVERQGGPAGRIGGGHEVLTEALGRLVERCGEVEVGLFAPRLAAAAQVAAVEAAGPAREAAVARHEALADIFNVWLWSRAGNLYWQYGTFAAPVVEKVFNNDLSALPTRRPWPTAANPNATKRCTAAEYFHAYADSRAGIKVEGFTYAPGLPVQCRIADVVRANLWINCHYVGAGGGDISIWLRHLTRLIPHEQERKTLIQWMAWNVQNPGKKCNWHPIWIGDPGTGKDTAIRPMIFAISGAKTGIQPNVGHVSLANLDSQFNDWLKNELIVVEEMKEDSGREQRQLSNKLKPLMAAPPETVSINAKFIPPYPINNVSAWIFLTNHANAIAIESKDRRFFVLHSACAPMTPAEKDEVWDWYAAGGLEAVAGELHAMDVSAFDPNTVPEMTEAKRTMIDYSRSDIESAIFTMIAEQTGPFSRGIFSPTTEGVMTIGYHLAAQSPPKIPKMTVIRALIDAGWHDHGRLGAKLDGENINMRRVFTVSNDYWLGLSKTEVRLRLDGSPAQLEKVIDNIIKKKTVGDNEE